jgi:hypothetical protein
MEALTIESYLRGKVGYEVPDSALITILSDRGVTSGSDVSELDTKTKDLCTADLYMWCASTPSSRDSTSDEDGQWKHTEGGWETSAYDKRQLRAMANDIYDRYKESAGTSGIRLINL